MTTTNLTIGNDWVALVADTDTKWIIQNIGNGSVFMRYEAAATPPAADAYGMVIGHGDGLVASIHGAGFIYAKAYTENDTCEVTVIK